MTDEEAAATLRRILGPRWQVEPVAPTYKTELTPIGEQLVIPGCERQPAAGKPAQLSLFGG